MARHADRNAMRRVKAVLHAAEADGLIVWTGEWRDGQKVYARTDEGLEWARQVLADVDDDDD
jgi:DNA-binding PadR family transcriptional regulator